MLSITSVVKDESDCIQHMVDYHISKGVKMFWFMDNMSTDGTYEILESYKKRNDIEFHLLYDPEVNHYQSYKMIQLANLAYNHGARYILPLDGDELLVTDQSIPELCSQLYSIGCASIDWKHYHITEKDDQNEPNPFKRMQYTSGTQKYLFKSLIKWKHGIRIWQGNHGIDNPGNYEQINLKGAYVANFPWRSKNQMRSKVINNGISHKNIVDNAEEIKSNYNGFLTQGEKFIDQFYHNRVIQSKELEYLPIL